MAVTHSQCTIVEVITDRWNAVRVTSNYVIKKKPYKICSYKKKLLKIFYTCGIWGDIAGQFSKSWVDFWLDKVGMVAVAKLCDVSLQNITLAGLKW